MSNPLSMTGFGRAEAAFEQGEIACEVRTVNSRHLETRIRLPRELAALENELKKRAASYFERGQVDVSVRLARESRASAAVEINEDLARSYAEAAERMRADLGLSNELSISSLLSLPGVSRLREPEIEADAIAAAAREATDAACAAAVEMRQTEGRALAEELSGRVGRIEDAVSQVEARAAEVRGAQRERFEKRLANLAPDVEIDAVRIEQEVVLYIDRMDVTEETVRLRSHCAQFRETLAEGGPIGRKLEFLLQEMGRETNTIGSKASDTTLARVVVDSKSELEKLREQVLNVE